MIDASVKVLRAKGLADEHIFFDKFCEAMAEKFTLKNAAHTL